MAEKISQTLEIGVTEVRRSLGELLDQVQRKGKYVVVDKLGTPIAAIISIQDYDEFKQLKAQKMHRELGRKIGAEASKQGLTSEQLGEDIEETRKTLFKEDYAELA